MFAVVETGGKQYQIEEGRYIDVELLEGDPETTVTLDSVVAIIAGEKTQVGQPYIEGASITAKILKHDKDKKVLIYKMRKKKGYRLKKGHRQNYTRILVENIAFPNKEETVKYAKTVEENTVKAQKPVKEKQETKAKKVAKPKAAKAEPVAEPAETKEISE